MRIYIVGAPKRFQRSGEDFTGVTLVFKNVNQEKAYLSLLSGPRQCHRGGISLLLVDVVCLSLPHVAVWACVGLNLL